MVNTASLTKEKISPEQEAWELFEVGSYEEVVQLSSGSPSVFIQHLGFISRIEMGQYPGNSLPVGMSILSPVVEAYVSIFQKKWQEASNHLEVYYRNKNAIISYPFAKLTYKVFSETGKLEEALTILTAYRKKYADLALLKEEVILCYQLKRYHEVVNLYSSYPRELNDAELLRVVGMSFLLLGKNRDAEAILEKIPGRADLPSFEEKRKEFEEVYKQIDAYEKKRKSLAPKELEAMGFAYLFHEEYGKAESVFMELVALLKQ